jgi:hypothetical protein
MDTIANSYEAVRGVTPASGTPLGTTELMNQNANKLFDFLRKKLAVPYRYVYREFVIPQLVKKLKGEDIVRLTGSVQMLEGFRRIVAEGWFNKNLAIIGPHTPEMKEVLIQEKILELQDTDPILKNARDIWKEITPRLQVTIVGESYNVSEVETILQMLPVVQNPQQAEYLVRYVLASKGIVMPEFPTQAPAGQGQERGAPAEEASPTQGAPVPAEV